MDRKSYQKVIKHILLGFILASTLTVGTGIMVKTENKTYQTQMDEMIVMHPDQEQELKESFHYYRNEMNIIFFRFWLFLIIIAILLFCYGYCIQLNKIRKEKSENLSNLKQLYDQLEQYKKRNYQIRPSFITKESYFNHTEEWFKIVDSLRELGYYFTALKEKTDREENSTKALITDISHQLKTPLSSLRMSHELAQELELTHEERQEFLLKEEQEINKLEALLAELVNLSRLENNMIQIKPELTGIKKTLTEAVNQVFMKAFSKDIKLQVDLQDDVMVYHDSKWTVEAISNVLDNAIKYSNPGSLVSVCVHKLPSLLLIEIEDEGIGIPAEELHRIYQRFYRGAHAGKQVKEGAGIGLYLSRRILEEQGGTIVAKRKQQKGTIFQITLPI